MDYTGFLADLADLLEIDAHDCSPDFVLAQGNWSSLSVVGTIALIDDYFEVIASGKSLIQCTTVADILRLVADRSKS